ncbi:MAG TPA: 2-phospho-L-lactate transferase [Gammaproteobacteria bacterium]|nr:2-phospho-L-lactate transferase [Gammaproteobacteria bacterium]
MNKPRIIALSGGVGGAKLADGLMRATHPIDLTLVVNTGDDFNHLGLHISPDIDTALYTLSDEVNPETGWGRRDETWSFMQTLKQFSSDTWFLLGDKDLAIHITRTQQLAAGQSLSTITSVLATSLGLQVQVLPMSNDPVRTWLQTDIGELAFQHYFVREQCKPKVQHIEFRGAAQAQPAPEVIQALQDPHLGAIILCPSNPYLSMAPILAIPGLRQQLRAAGVPIIAVSPLVGGQAVKGPTTKIMQELKLPVSALQIVEHYAGLIDGFVLDERDAHLAEQINIPVTITDTLMQTREDRIRVAMHTLAFAQTLKSSSV